MPYSSVGGIEGLSGNFAVIAPRLLDRTRFGLVSDNEELCSLFLDSTGCASGPFRSFDGSLPLLTMRQHRAQTLGGLCTGAWA